MTQIELSDGVHIVKTLARCLMAISHPSRLEILRYCIESRTFTEIIVNLRLNPASFMFHVGVLMDCNGLSLIRKPKRGLYETTELGKSLVRLVDKATSLSKG